MSTVRICGRDDVESGAAKRFDVEGHRIAVVRIEDDFYAIGDRCSHADFSLAEGDVYPEDKTIECWKHGSMFDLRTGMPKTLPATKPVPVYNIFVKDDDVMLE